MLLCFKYDNIGRREFTDGMAFAFAFFCPFFRPHFLLTTRPGQTKVIHHLGHNPLIDFLPSSSRESKTSIVLSSIELLPYSRMTNVDLALMSLGTLGRG